MWWWYGPQAKLQSQFFYAGFSQRMRWEVSVRLHLVMCHVTIKSDARCVRRGVTEFASLPSPRSPTDSSHP